MKLEHTIVINTNKKAKNDSRPTKKIKQNKCPQCELEELIRTNQTDYMVKEKEMNKMNFTGEDK
jgi:hypothetical protein